MCRIETIFKPFLLMLLAVALVGCGKKGIIERSKMTHMLADMYLADQVIEVTPSLMLQKDTVLVYPSIMKKYGVTPKEYEASVRYYLQEGEAYIEILKDVKKMLYDKEAEISRILKNEVDMRKAKSIGSWWAVDSVRCAPADEFLYNGYLRSLRWMVMMDEKLHQWHFMDSAIVDIPQNPKWWTNTLTPARRSFNEFFERKSKITEEEKVVIEEIIENEKVIGELPGDLESRRALVKKRLPGFKRQ